MISLDLYFSKLIDVVASGVLLFYEIVCCTEDYNYKVKLVAVLFS